MAEVYAAKGSVPEEVATRQAKVELFPPPWSAWSASRVSSSCASPWCRNGSFRIRDRMDSAGVFLRAERVHDKAGIVVLMPLCLVCAVHENGHLCDQIQGDGHLVLNGGILCHIGIGIEGQDASRQLIHNIIGRRLHDGVHQESRRQLHGERRENVSCAPDLPRSGVCRTAAGKQLLQRHSGLPALRFRSDH